MKSTKCLIIHMALMSSIIIPASALEHSPYSSAQQLSTLQQCAALATLPCIAAACYMRSMWQRHKKIQAISKMTSGANPYEGRATNILSPTNPALSLNKIAGTFRLINDRMDWLPGTAVITSRNNLYTMTPGTAELTRAKHGIHEIVIASNQTTEQQCASYRTALQLITDHNNTEHLHRAKNFITDIRINHVCRHKMHAMKVDNIARTFHAIITEMQHRAWSGLQTDFSCSAEDRTMYEQLLAKTYNANKDIISVDRLKDYHVNWFMRFCYQMHAWCTRKYL